VFRTAPFDRFDVWPPRVYVHCDFACPKLVHERLRVTTYLTHFGLSPIGIDSDAVHMGACLAATHKVLVCVDPATNKSPAIPPWFRDLLRPSGLGQVEARTVLNGAFGGG
jgi:acyl-CoA thioesterase FadM